MSEDAIFRGALTLFQHTGGYRFGIDALLLAATVLTDSGASRILDVGCGVGVIGLAAAYFLKGAEVVGVEVQPGLAGLARRNAQVNGLQDRVTIVGGDIRDIGDEEIGDFELALMNPPYYPVSGGRLNPSAERAAAKHEVNGTLQQLLVATVARLRSQGKLRLIYPAEELVRLLDCVRRIGLKATRLRPVHSFADSPARFVLLDVQQSGRREMQIDRGVVIFDSPGIYTDAVEAILDGHRPTDSS